MFQAAFAFITGDEEDKRTFREDAWQKPRPDAVFEIYLITNTVNGKRYVGQAWYGSKRRWQEHVRLARSPEPALGIRGAIQKYGPDVFTFEVIDCAADERALDELEIKWIKQLNTFAPNGQGYNLTEGGGGCRKWQPTVENLANMAAANRKVRETPEWQAAMDDAVKRRLADPAYMAEMRRVGDERIAKSDAADPEGAEQRAYNRAATARNRARAQGLDVPKITFEDIIAAHDAADPEGAERRAKFRRWRRECEQRKAERIALDLPSDPVEARNILDPEGSAKRAYGRAAVARDNARKRGENVPKFDRRAAADAHNASRDAEDPAGVKTRALRRSSKARATARKRGEDVPLLHATLAAEKIAQTDALDPAGAAKRAKQREANKRCDARRAAGLLPPKVDKRRKRNGSAPVKISHSSE